MPDPHTLIWSAPALLLLGALLFEVVYFLIRRRARGGPPWTVAAWALRPWALWAVFNLVFRLNWDRGFNNRRTFPFFANLSAFQRVVRQNGNVTVKRIGTDFILRRSICDKRERQNENNERGKAYHNFPFRLRNVANIGRLWSNCQQFYFSCLQGKQGDIYLRAMELIRT